MHGNGLRRGRQRTSLTTGRVTKNPRRKRHSKAKIKTLDAESAEEDAALDSSEDEQEDIEAELNHDDEGDVGHG